MFGGHIRRRVGCIRRRLIWTLARRNGPSLDWIILKATYSDHVHQISMADTIISPYTSAGYRILMFPHFPLEIFVQTFKATACWWPIVHYWLNQTYIRMFGAQNLIQGVEHKWFDDSGNIQLRNLVQLGLYSCTKYYLPPVSARSVDSWSDMRGMCKTTVWWLVHDILVSIGCKRNVLQ